MPAKATDLWWRRLAWFVGLWAASVAALALVALAIRAVLR